MWYNVDGQLKQTRRSSNRTLLLRKEGAVFFYVFILGRSRNKKEKEMPIHGISMFQKNGYYITCIQKQMCF